jgi:hypothetical protein
MIEDYPNLSWALSLNPNLETMISGEYGNNTDYLSKLENLILDLKTLKCKGIQEEVKDVSDLNKFLSIISELETARILGKRGNAVNLLPDNYFSGRSPDLLCKNKIMSSYIEVTRLNDNPYISDPIITYLRELLRSYPYRVDVVIKEKLSIPKVRGRDRLAQSILVKASLNEFDSKFKNTTFSVFPHEIDTRCLIFKIYKTDSGNGYPGVVSSTCVKIPSENLRDYVKERLTKKAEKREDFKNNHLTYPYILTFDCDEPFIDDDDLDNLLYGITNSIAILASNASPAEKQKHIILRDTEWENVINEKTNSHFWNDIEYAKENGWKDFLLEKRIIPTDFFFRTDDGLFLAEPLMKNVSGVLFKNKTHKVFFYPNPFCFDKINNPHLENNLFNQSSQND